MASRTWRSGHLRSGVTMLENRLPPPILALAVALAMWPAAALPAPLWRTTAALLLFGIAGAFGVPALRSFRRAETTIDPVRIERASRLVTDGVFGLTRNPMYVSLVLMLAALALWLGGPWVWAGPLGFALFIDRLQIRPEERALEALFGADYVRYKSRVRRWI